LDKIVTRIIDCPLSFESFLGFVFLEGRLSVIFQNSFFNVIVGMRKVLLIFGVFHELKTAFGAVFLSND
jgi:hypothetical protein